MLICTVSLPEGPTSDAQRSSTTSSAVRRSRLARGLSSAIARAADHPAGAHAAIASTMVQLEWTPMSTELHHSAVISGDCYVAAALACARRHQTRRSPLGYRRSGQPRSTQTFTGTLTLERRRRRTHSACRGRDTVQRADMSPVSNRRRARVTIGLSLGTWNGDSRASRPSSPDATALRAVTHRQLIIGSWSTLASANGCWRAARRTTASRRPTAFQATALEHDRPQSQRSPSPEVEATLPVRRLRAADRPLRDGVRRQQLLRNSAAGSAAARSARPAHPARSAARSLRFARFLFERPRACVAHDAAAGLQLLLVRLKRLGSTSAISRLLLLRQRVAPSRPAGLAIARQLRDRLKIDERDLGALRKRFGGERRRLGGSPAAPARAVGRGLRPARLARLRAGRPAGGAAGAWAKAVSGAQEQRRPTRRQQNLSLR